MSENFVVEPLKDNDSKLSSIINNGSLTEVWDIFKGDNSRNIYDTFEDMKENM